MKSLWYLLFLPHEHNNHRALILKPSFIGIFIALYLLNQSFVRSLTIIRPGILGYSSEITAQKVFDQTNQLRLKAGLEVLHYNPVLSTSAADKARDMFASNYWAHNSPQGRTPWDFFRQQGYQYSIAGENLAKDFYDTETMMRAWMNSPTHRANIVNTKYQEIGIGVVNGVLNGVKTTLVVQHFGTPLNGVVNSATNNIPETVSTGPVLAQADAPVDSKFMISPLQISQIVGAIMFLIIIGVLVVDVYLTLKNKHHRLTSNSYSHIGYLVIILVLLLATKAGNILP